MSNQPPVVPDSPSITVAEQSAALINPGLTVSDADLDARNGSAGDYAGASFTISRDVANVDDLFSFDLSGADFTVSGNNLSSGGQVFGTFTQSGGSLTITFSSSGTPATTALVNEVLEHLQYTNLSASPPSSVTLDYSLNDGAPGGGQGAVVDGNNIDGGTITVNIDAVDDGNAIIGDENGNVLFGTSGNDSIMGLGGDDQLIGGAGDDLLDGGDGRDLANYGPSQGPVLVNLAAGTATGDGNDILVAIEDVLGSAYDDSLTGDGDYNVLNGGGGDDVIHGAGGDDTVMDGEGDDQLFGDDGNDQLIGGVGDDLLDGGDGQDIADYSRAIGGVVVDLASGTATGADGNDTLVSVERIQGSVYDDSLTGDGGNNYIAGSGGDDVIYGAGGDDGLYGGDGNDQIHGGGENDGLGGGAGDDLLDGGDGEDIVDYGSAAGSVTVDLGAGTSSGADGNDTLVNIEWISGSAYGDSLTGDGVYNFIAGGGSDDTIHGAGGDDSDFGGDGDDHLYGDDGNDQLVGEAGDDLLDGGEGRDVADYQYANGGVVVDLSAGTASGADGNDTIVNVEDVKGSAFDDQISGNGGDNFIDAFDGNDVVNAGGGNDYVVGSLGNDVLSGQAGYDVLDGGDGNDGLNGGANNDSLVGGAGNDFMIGGLGDDTLDGGDGFDRIGYFAGTTTGVTVDLRVHGPQYVGELGWDTISNVEAVSGTIFADTLTGDDNGNWLWGSISGGGATNNDTLDGQDGDDLLEVGAGNHSLTGGSGIDTVQYSENGGPEVGIAVDLNLQGGAQNTNAGSWTLNGIENLSAGDGDDVLTGDLQNNILAGAAGSDSLAGGDGTDTLYGDGSIVMDFQNGVISYDPENSRSNSGAADGNDTLDGGSGDDTLYGGGGADVLTGGAGNDLNYGGSGDDLIRGRAGDDLIDGGDGYDRAGYYHTDETAGGVTVDLNIVGPQDTGSQGVDTLVSIEYVSGTPFADTLTGDGNDNILWGSTATIDPGNWVSTTNNDTLDGGGGNDLLVAGIGNQTLTGGDGIDTVGFTENFGDDPAIRLSLMLQGVAQDSGVGQWTLSGIENLSGGNDNDELTGDDNVNILGGSTGDDVLRGMGGNDTLYGDGGMDSAAPASGPPTQYPDDGSNGSDTLDGGAGDDQLFGGGGSDTASFASETGGVQAFLYNGGFGEAFAADGYDQLHDIENLTGSAFNDQLLGNNLDNVLSGGDGIDLLRGRAGNDTLQAGAGDDYLDGGLGDDILDGGDGWDRLSYFGSASGPVTIDLRIQGVAQDTGQGNDTLIDIEHVGGTIYGDTLTGNDGQNVIRGASDGLGSPVDHLDGQGGDDLISDGAGDHVLDGGDGTDTFLYEQLAIAGGITVSLALQGAAQDTGVGNMTLTNFENLTGTNFGDTLTGDGNANVLAGDLGDDTLSGGAGNDSLYGDGRVFMDTQGTGLSGPIALAADAGATGGNDTLEGGLGDDLINGGAGTDTASYEHTGGAVSVDLRFGSASGADGNDTLVSIENVIGSGFDDTINGDGADNVLSGLGGNDFIQGQGGNDTIYGGDGDDTLRGDAAETSLTVSGDDVLYGEAGNDGLRGGLGNDQLHGGSGNDLLRGNGGVDYYDGGIDDGEGFNGIGDRVSFFDARATQGAVADLRTGIISNDGYGNVETMVNIESLGADTAFIDTFYGNDARNFIGGSRGDNLYAFGGDDVFQIGAAPAVVDGGSGIDAINLDSNGGWLTPDSNADGLAESAGAATVGWTVNLAAGTMVDGYGNAGTVTGIENVNGSQLGDSLTGTGGANVLSGFDGDDTLNGRAGNDTLDGGNGVDTANYANATGAVTVDLMAGTATGADGNDTLTSIENVIGSNFGDSIFGDSGPNRLDGGNGNDRLISGGGNDLLYGGNGNDILKGELGDDLIDGGAGIDMAKFYHSDAALGGVTVSLLLQGSAQYVGSLGWDTLISIENIYGTPFADTITGDDGDNWLSGSEATIAGVGVSATNNDVIDGRGGNDVLSVGLGNHMLTGGSGIDTVAFSEGGFPEVGLTIDLNLQGGAQATGAGSWTLNGFENVAGGQLDDMLTGDGGANILAGNAGNDTLVGGVGDDVLYGDGTIDLNTNRVITTFADVGVTFGWADGNDTLEGGLGDDTLNGGGGRDTASYEHASGAVTVLLNDSGGGTSSGADGNDTLTSIENVTGSAYNDTLLGNSSANVLTGGAGIDILSAWGGNDTLLAGDGADYLSGGMGDDLIDGGAGYDRAAYNLGATSGVTVDLNIQGTAQNTIGAGMDTLIGIEDLSGTGFSDVLTGNAQNNWIWGGSNGFATTGNDTIDAGGGDDLVEVGAGNQTVSGGAGNDTLSLWAHGGAEISSAGVAFSLGAQGTTQNWRQGTIAATGFENVSGSRYDDALTGDGNANTLLGDAGSDTLVGGAGNDTLYGDGRFVADWGPTSAPWGFSLYADLERDYGSGTGLDGNDLLEGGLGNDTIDGGGGTDTASYAHASGAVTVTLAASGGSSSGADGADILVSIENLTGSAFNDALTGNAGANRLDGGAGNDSIQGGAGDDVLIGGDGADALDGGTGINTADYSGSSAGVSVNLQNGKGTGGTAASDTLTNVQNVVGSSFNDNLVGTSAANMLSGGAGNDTFNGGGGADVLTGGAGSDLFAFKAAADIGTAASHDALMDFEAGGATAATAIDHIDLSAIDAVARTATRDDAFSFIGTGAFTSHAGELRVQVIGDHVANILGDTNGDGVADFVMEVHYAGTLDASDFVL